MVGRRTLLVGGGAALVAAGCGRDEVLTPPPPEPALLRSLAAERALGATMAALEEPHLAERSRERAQRLAAALSELGARPHDAPAPAARADIAAALRRSHALLEAYVAALPSPRRAAARTSASSRHRPSRRCCGRSRPSERSGRP